MIDDFPPGGFPEYLTEVSGGYCCYWISCYAYDWAYCGWDLGSGFFSSSWLSVAHGESLLTALF